VKRDSEEAHYEILGGIYSPKGRGGI